MRLPEVFESVDNRYRVERYLGEGGSGRVYLVVCQEDSCCYALKVSADDEVSRVSLYREARILSSLVHPAFPTVREIWEAHGLSGDVLYQGKNIADADGQEIVSGREVF